MTTTRYTDGAATVVVTQDLERQLLDLTRQRLVPGILDAMQAEAEQQASESRAAWYRPGSGVTRRTGRGGDIEVTTTISPTEVKVSVGSVTPYAAFQHRPGAFPTKTREIPMGMYYRLKAANPARAFHAKKSQPGKGIEAGKYYEIIPQRSEDGKYLVPELVRKPFMVRKATLVALMSKSIAERLNHG